MVTPQESGGTVHLDTQIQLTGYAENLSRRTGQKVVFCLDESVEAGVVLPVQAVSDEVVGEVTVGPREGGRSVPPEPWCEGFNFSPRATFELGSSLPSGVYTLGGKIPFVHRRKGSAPIAVLLPSNTATAFNPAGGRRFYKTGEAEPADVLSFQRPVVLAQLLTFCAPLVKWFASERRYADNATYLIDSDLEDPDALDGVEVLVVIGRSEYWTRTARMNFDAFVYRGGRALLLCSEIMYWQVRFDDARQRLYRYRGTDPHPDPLQRTTVWRAPSLQYPVYPYTGGERWYGGLNADEEGLGWRGMRITSPDSPLLVGSGLAKGDVVPLPDAVNWDGAPAELGSDGVPRVDFGGSAPWRHEVIGYNLVKPTEPDYSAERPAISLWIAMRWTPCAGTVIHGGTMGWCGPGAIGSRSRDSVLTRSLIAGMLDVLLDDVWPFSTPPELGEGAYGRQKNSNA